MTTRPMLKIHRPPKKPRKKPVFVASQHVFMRALYKSPMGLTDGELAIKTGKGEADARGRRRELYLMGFVEDTGLTRKTKTGRKSTVWILSKAGVQKLISLKEGSNA